MSWVPENSAPLPERQQSDGVITIYQWQPNPEIVCDMAASGNATSFVNSAFNRPEADYLNQQPSFGAAVAKATTLDDYDRLCYIGQDLLNLRQATDPQLPSLRQRRIG